MAHITHIIPHLLKPQQGKGLPINGPMYISFGIKCE